LAWFWRSLRAYDHPLNRFVRFSGRILSPKQWVNGWIEGSPYRREGCSKIIAISEMVKRDMIRWYRIPEDRVTVVYNGIDLDRFHPRNRQYREEIRRRHGIGEAFVPLFVSNNFRMKGLGPLMKALSGLKEKSPVPLKLMVLGRDRQQRYRRLADRIGISGEVLFVGSTDEPEKYYGAADLLVHPSFYDACSLTVLEALASGLPVITSSSNGASGILHQGKEGFVISDPRDEKDLEEKMSVFLDPKRREEASRAARTLAEEHSTERNWREMRAVFDKIKPFPSPQRGEGKGEGEFLGKGLGMKKKRFWYPLINIKNRFLFGSYGKDVYIEPGVVINRPRYVHIGDGVRIKRNTNINVNRGQWVKYPGTGEEKWAEE